MKKKLKSITEKEIKTLMLQLIAEMSEEKNFRVSLVFNSSQQLTYIIYVCK